MKLWMDPYLVLPLGPVLDYQVSSGMPVECSHRRQRHPPLLHATEWMKAMYHGKPSRHEGLHPRFKNTPEIIGEGGDNAELLSKDVGKSFAESSDRDARPQIPEQIPEPRASLAEKPSAVNPQTVPEQTAKSQVQPAVRGAGFPRINYGQPSKHTALGSHAPSGDEKDYSVWLEEGWRRWKMKKEMQSKIASGNASVDSLGGEGAGARAERTGFRGGLKGLFCRK